MSDNAKTKQIPEDKKTPGIPKTSNAIMALWEKAADRLTDAELDWFSDLSDSALVESENLSQNLEGMACLVGSDKFSESFQDPNSLSVLMYSLSNQLDVINGLLRVSGEAEGRLKRKKQEAQS